MVVGLVQIALLARISWWCVWLNLYQLLSVASLIDSQVHVLFFDNEISGELMKSALDN